MASCCTLSASWSSSLSFLETKAGFQPCQHSVRAGSAVVLVMSRTSHVAVFARCCSSCLVQLSLFTLQQ